MLDELASELGNHVIVAKLNVDKNPLGAMKYQIQGIPTLKLFH
ncbi:thioredoxin [Paenibacillus alginolyticus]|nr:thioredoxin domain-containing protein [Paenibacillus alginolyticus]MCY9667538.1 thioredoxin [Paenibacillus alginolyticus]